MATKIDPKDPSQTSDAHKAMSPQIDKMRAVLGGTLVLRERPEFLPQHDKESNKNYRERLSRATLYNVTDMTLTSWVGQVFKEPPEVKAGLDPKISSLFDDIDQKGNALGVFAREWFKEGLSFALAPMLVLFPQATAVAEGEPRTLKTDAQEGRRPYWQPIAPENVLFVRTERLSDGREVFSHVRILTCRIEPEGFVDTYIPQIHVYTKMDVTVFEETKVRGKSVWKPIGEPFVHDLGEVPMVVFYSEKLDTMVGKSSIFDLADLNIAHWQSSSDQLACLTVARFPILAGTGVPDDQTIDIGPRKYLHSDNEAAKFYYVEHAGAALTAGQVDLDKLEARMSNYGAEFLKKRPGRETASARILDSAEATSPIEDVAERFNDALAQALYFTSLWLKIEAPPIDALQVQTRFGQEEDEEELTAPPKKKAA